MHCDFVFLLQDVFVMNRVLLRSLRQVSLISTRPVLHNSNSFHTSAFVRNSDGGRPPIHQDPPADGPSIPEYVENFHEPVSQKRSRLLYQSRKRGILENGLLLASFADKHLKDFDEEELALYDRLINLPSNDWDIYYWATGVKQAPEEFQNVVMDKLIKHARNEDRESRITQPDLKF